MSDDNISCCKRFMWIIYILIQQFVAIIVGYSIAISFDGYIDELWLWHKMITPIGVLCMMFEGILAFSPYNHITSDFKKTTLNNLHGCFMTAGFFIMTVGISFAFVTNDNGHFISLHGICGLVAYILCAISTLGGLLTKFNKLVINYIRLIYLRCLHVFIGVLGIIASLIALGLGLNSLDEKKPYVYIVISLLVPIGLILLPTSGVKALKYLKKAITS